MRTAEYLDVARARAKIPSDYALAARLKVTRSAVSNWRHGNSFPEPLLAYKIAELSEADPLRVLADIELERAERGNREDAVAGWRDILQKIGGVAAGIACVAGLSITPSPAQSAPVNNAGVGLYIMSTRRRMSALRAMARALVGQPLLTPA